MSEKDAAPNTSSRTDFRPRATWKQFFGSTIALGLGVVLILGRIPRISQGEPNALSHLIAGVVMVLGALAYKSAKKRHLGFAKTSPLRYAIETVCLMGILLAVLGQKNVNDLMYEDPVTNLVIPIWAFLA